MENNFDLSLVSFSVEYGCPCGITLPEITAMDADWESAEPDYIIKAGTSDVLVRKAGHHRLLHIGADSSNNPEAFVAATGSNHLWLVWSYDDLAFVAATTDWDESWKLLDKANKA